MQLWLCSEKILYPQKHKMLKENPENTTKKIQKQGYNKDKSKT